MNFKFDSSGGIGVLTFYGNLSRDRANELREALMVSVENAHHLVVNLENVTKLDSHCLQAIYTACRTAQRLNKGFTVNGVYSNKFSSDSGQDTSPRYGQTAQGAEKEMRETTNN